MPKVFRLVCSSVLAATVAGAIFASDARASDCSDTSCLSGVTQYLKTVRSDSKLAGGTLDQKTRAGGTRVGRPHEPLTVKTTARRMVDGPIQDHQQQPKRTRSGEWQAWSEPPDGATGEAS